jgi:CubicO group peptidase (beta-lactamase class C family)
MISAHFKKLIVNRVQKAIAEGVFPGCVLGITHTGGERQVHCFGHYTYESGSKRVGINTLYDVASITKSIPTASLALMLIDQGRLELEDKLIQYVPEFLNKDREKVLIRHLLTHTLHFDFRLSEYKQKTADEILGMILHRNFKSPPGAFFSYSNATSILLGMVVERVCEGTLDHLADKYFFTPLQMKRTSFYPLKRFSKEEIAPTEFDQWRNRLLLGEVHDESASVLQSRITTGSAGLFSTAPDLLNFLEMLLNGGIYKNRRYISQKVIELMHTSQLAGREEVTGLGWELCQPEFMGRYCTDQTFGKTGFTGCVCLCDIGKKIGFVLLSNWTYPGRKNTKHLIQQVRRDIADLIFTSL